MRDGAARGAHHGLHGAPVAAQLPGRVHEAVRVVLLSGSGAAGRFREPRLAERPRLQASKPKANERERTERTRERMEAKRREAKAKAGSLLSIKSGLRWELFFSFLFLFRRFACRFDSE